VDLPNLANTKKVNQYNYSPIFPNLNLNDIVAFFIVYSAQNAPSLQIAKALYQTLSEGKSKQKQIVFLVNNVCVDFNIPRDDPLPLIRSKLDWIFDSTEKEFWEEDVDGRVKGSNEKETKGQKSGEKKYEREKETKIPSIAFVVCAQTGEGISKMLDLIQNRLQDMTSVDTSSNKSKSRGCQFPSGDCAVS